MIEIDIPDFGRLQLVHLVMDYNGTLAIDGKLIDGVVECLKELSGKLQLHVLTADTFGLARKQLQHAPCKLIILAQPNQAQAKLDYIDQIGADQTVCIGNGRNDRLMLAEAALGIAIILKEGAAMETIMAADVVVNDIQSAFELLLKPLRLTATLRE